MKYAVEMGSVYDDIHTKFLKDYFRFSKVDREYTHTDTQTEM
jgi:hypothetical protein